MDTCIGEGDATPLQYSCLENPMDGRAWYDPGQMSSDPRHIDLLLTSANQEKPLGQQDSALIMRQWALLCLFHLARRGSLGAP